MKKEITYNQLEEKIRSDVGFDNVDIVTEIRNIEDRKERMIRVTTMQDDEEVFLFSLSVDKWDDDQEYVISGWFILAPEGKYPTVEKLTSELVEVEIPDFSELV